jgi:hypothetical protein
MSAVRFSPRLAAQLALYLPLMAILGYFSTEPRFSVVGPGEALVRVSFIHSTERKEKCRNRSAEELAKLAPNMRAALDCPRERSDVKVEVEMDGRVLYSISARPSGLRHDLPSSIYRRLDVPAGRHVFRARLADTADGAFRRESQATVDLAPGRVLVIDYVASRGGFEFRS